MYQKIYRRGGQKSQQAATEAGVLEWTLTQMTFLQLANQVCD